MANAQDIFNKIFPNVAPAIQAFGADNPTLQRAASAYRDVAASSGSAQGAAVPSTQQQWQQQWKSIDWAQVATIGVPVGIGLLLLLRKGKRK